MRIKTFWGKTAIGYCIGQASVGSAYGAAGSMVVLLVWVYYSALIVFFGAEFTHAWATRHDPWPQAVRRVRDGATDQARRGRRAPPWGVNRDWGAPQIGSTAPHGLTCKSGRDMRT
jgi:Virulence factor BrkB